MDDQLPSDTSDDDTNTIISTPESSLHCQPYCVTELVLNAGEQAPVSTPGTGNCARRVTQTLVDSGSVMSFMTKDKALDLGVWQYVSKTTRYRKRSQIWKRDHGFGFQKDRACATDFAGNSVRRVGTLEVSFSAYKRSRDEPALGDIHNRRITITVVDSPRHSLGCDWVLGCDSGFVWPIMSDLFVKLQAANNYSNIKSSLALRHGQLSETSELLRPPDKFLQFNSSVQSIAAVPASLSRVSEQRESSSTGSVPCVFQTPIYYDPSVLYQPKSYYMQDADDRSSHPSKDLVIYVDRPLSVNSCSTTLRTVVYPEARDMSYDVDSCSVNGSESYYQSSMMSERWTRGHAIEV